MKCTSQNTVVGFIGIGIMGRQMAMQIQKAGYKLHVYSRTQSKAEQLIADGAIWHDTPADLASVCDAIITMVGFPSDVSELYLGKSGLIENSRPGTILIDMTTSSPALAASIHAQASAIGRRVLDAPVSGGELGASNAALSIMVGGDPVDFSDALPLLECLGKHIALHGVAGAGQHAKMANQIAIAANLTGACEALAYASAAGLDPQKVLQSIGSGAAGSWQLSNMGPRMLDKNSPPIFYVKHFLKDLTIAMSAADALGQSLPACEFTKEQFDRLDAMGQGDEGTQRLYSLYRK